MTMFAGPTHSATFPSAGRTPTPTLEPLGLMVNRLEIESKRGPAPGAAKSPRTCAGDEGRLPACEGADPQPPGDVIGWVRASRAAQGLSLGVEDPAILMALRKTLLPSRCARDQLRWRSRP